jgi:hypothetical protein
VSRGHGRIQREILRIVADSPPFESRGYLIAELAAEIYNTDAPTESQRRAVQRAVKALRMNVWQHKCNLKVKQTSIGPMPTPGLVVWREPTTDEFMHLIEIRAAMGTDFETIRRWTYGSGRTIAEIHTVVANALSVEALREAPLDSEAS